MRKGYIYIVITIACIILIRTVVSMVPAGSRTVAYMIILALITAVFLGLVVWAWKKGKFK